MYPEHRYLIETRFNPSRLSEYGGFGRGHGDELGRFRTPVSLSSLAAIVAPMVAVAAICLVIVVMN